MRVRSVSSCGKCKQKEGKAAHNSPIIFLFCDFTPKGGVNLENRVGLSSMYNTYTRVSRGKVAIYSLSIYVLLDTFGKRGLKFPVSLYVRILSVQESCVILCVSSQVHLMKSVRDTPLLCLTTAAGYVCFAKTWMLCDKGKRISLHFHLPFSSFHLM